MKLPYNEGTLPFLDDSIQSNINASSTFRFPLFSFFFIGAPYTIAMLQAIAITLGHPPERDGKTLMLKTPHICHRT